MAISMKAAHSPGMRRASAEPTLKTARRAAFRLLLLLLCPLLLATGRSALADTMPSLYQSIAGNLNFTGTQKSLRTAANGNNACSVMTSAATTQATVSGVPAGAVVQAAHLYWAGSGRRADYLVRFEGATVVADINRRYTASTTAGGTTRRYFSGAADVTAIVAAKGGGTGNGSYAFSGLRVDNGSLYCSNETVLGGWALLVVYAHAAEEFRVFSLYEGFQGFQHDSFSLSPDNFRIPGNFNKGRIAHITWEGDPTLSGGGENLAFNGTVLNSADNPAGNQFNSVSTIGGTVDAASYGVDFDIYDVTAPLIQAGQTSASTLYSSGQDRVLLSAEIIAMPNTPVADLALALVRNEPLIPGRNLTYTMTVTNNGPGEEPGPITVTAQLPAVLTYVSAGGNGWTCGANGQTVTCVYGSGLASGALAPDLTMTAAVTSRQTGWITTDASVSGTLFDNVTDNNADSDRGMMSIPTYVFTDSACVRNMPFGPNQPCKPLAWHVQTAGQTLGAIYVTRVNMAGTPVQASAGGTTVMMRGALSCHNPAQHAGVQATLLAPGASTPLALPHCAANRATPTVWSSAFPMSYAAGEPSSGPLRLSYADVGQVAFHLQESATTGGSDASSGPFVFRPHDFVLSRIRCSTADAAHCGSGALGMPDAGDNPAAADALGPAFIRAGHPFAVTVTAINTQGNATPNFGREIMPESIGLKVDIVHPAGGKNPPLAGGFGPFSSGTAVGTGFTWDEVGIISLTPRMADGDYIGTGNLSGTPVPRVGRFFPHHFDISGTVTQRSDLPPMATSGSIYAGSTALMLSAANDIAGGHGLTIAGAGQGGGPLVTSVVAISGTTATLQDAAVTTVTGATVSKTRDNFTYMGEPMRLRLTMSAYSANESVTENYAGAFAKLGHAALGNGSRWFDTGCAGVMQCMGLGAVNNGTTALSGRLAIDETVAGSAPASAWSAGTGIFEASIRLGRPVTNMPDADWGPYLALEFGAAPRDADGVMLPALADDAAHGMDLDADVDGIAERRKIFSSVSLLGRSRIASAHGSELLQLPVGVTVQFWNGAHFVTNALDGNTRFPASELILHGFRGDLAAGETAVISSPATIAIANGTGGYVLARPGGGDGAYAGSVDMRLDVLNPYLPANVARARFGVFKGSHRIIDVRENF
jgi:MSHA biogenesis protein MshQ